MNYEKQTWECGETITAEKLNHIEDGIANASSGGGAEPVFINAVRMVKTNNKAVYTTDKTPNDILEAFGQNKIAYFTFNANDAAIGQDGTYEGDAPILRPRYRLLVLNTGASYLGLKNDNPPFGEMYLALEHIDAYDDPSMPIIITKKFNGSN